MYPHWVYVEEAKRAGVPVLLPCVNRSGEEFTLQDGAIRVGLGRIAGLTERGRESVYAARAARPVEGIADGTVWGGEFLVVDLATFRRAAHLECLPMPGGDMAAVEPSWMALSYLRAIHGRKALDLELPVLDALGRTKAEALFQMMEQGLNSPLTSSAGRLFDAAAALVGLRYTTSYEGHAACELEGIAAPDEKGSYPVRVVEEGDELVVIAKDIIAGVVEDLEAGSSPEIVSARFHNLVLDAIMILP